MGYTGAFTGLAGLDFDHEGLTFNPCGNTPVSITNLELCGRAIDIKVSGSGPHVESLKLNGRALGAACRKILWDGLKQKNRIEIVRSTKAAKHPCVIRADGLKVSDVSLKGARLSCVVGGAMSGELLVSAPAGAKPLVDGRPVAALRDDCGNISVPIAAGGRHVVELG